MSNKAHDLRQSSRAHAVGIIAAEEDTVLAEYVDQVVQSLGMMLGFLVHLPTHSVKYLRQLHVDVVPAVSLCENRPVFGQLPGCGIHHWQVVDDDAKCGDCIVEAHDRLQKSQVRVGSIEHQIGLRQQLHVGNEDGVGELVGDDVRASQPDASIQRIFLEPLEVLLELSPLGLQPADGVMYVTGPNQVLALDATTGAEIWNFTRARSSAGNISGDAARGASRGAALLGDRVFFVTDDAHLLCLHRLTGAVLWEVAMPEQPGRYGGTSAPLIVDDLVIGGMSGGDEDVRGFVAAYRATTGERVWRTWTVPTAGEALADTWKGDSNPKGGASWLTPSYDKETGVLYVSTGNPYPDTDGDARGGDNLYTDSDLALDARTGKLLWHFQFTPHDLHDWDANQPIVLIDGALRGAQRKLLLHANRNGFFYVLDRTNGGFLQGTPLVENLTWASGIDVDGRPKVLPGSEPTSTGVETCPAVRGATNWYSTAFNPDTQLYYVMTVEDCTLYRKAHDGGYGPVEHTDNPPRKVLRAIRVDSGKFAWEMPMVGHPERNYSGVLSTAGGLIFFGETGGSIAAADAASGKVLWHFESNQILKGSPMTYAVKGRQYVAIAAGANILAFALPEDGSAKPLVSGAATGYIEHGAR